MSLFALLLAAWTGYLLTLYPAILALDEGARLLAGGVFRCLVFAVPPLAWVSFVLRRPILDFFRLSRPLAGIGWGFGTGLLLLVFALVRAELVMPAGINPVWPSWSAWLSAVLLAPFCEELLFRGFYLQRLSERFTFWSANVLSAFLFVVIHFPGWIIIERSAILPVRFLTILDILLLGLISGWLLQRSRTLWACVVVHAINNLLSIVLFT